MKVLDIYENIPKTYNKNNTSLIWSDKIQNRPANFFSIFDLINDNSNLSKIVLNSHLKKFAIQNQNSFFSSFDLKKDFSFLTLSNIVEKNPYKKNFNLELIKKFNIEFFLKKKKFDKIYIHSQNKNFVDKINAIVNKKNIKIDYFIIIKNYARLTIIFFKRLINLLFFIKNINFIKKEKIQINKNPFFFSFFSYTNKDLALNKIYSSEYWKGFKNTKDKNWVHLFDPSSTYPRSKEVSKIIKNLNNCKSSHNHFFLNDYLDLRMVLKTFFIFTKFFFIMSKLMFSIKFLNILKKEFLLTKKSHFLFFEEFMSFNSVRNILFFFQFEKFFSLNKINSKIFYCFENQPWEKIMLYFVKKKFPKIKTYGVIHSAVRFWDFRFINFCNKNQKKIGYYNPDKILCNSYFVKQILFKNGFEKKNLLTVETLRYLSLKKINYKNKTIKKEKYNILFLSDYDNNLNKYIISFIRKLNTYKYSLFLKCHPLTPIDISQKNLKKITSFEEVENKIDFCIVGNKTAASLDLYYKNLKLLIFVEKDDLDYSPLNKFIKYNTISSVEDLDNIINSKKKLDYGRFKKKYFIIDKDLTRWNKILR